MAIGTQGGSPTPILQRTAVCYPSRRTELRSRQRVDDVTLRDSPVSAGGDHPRKFRAKRFEKSEPALDRFEMRRCQPPSTIAGLIGLLLQLKQVTHRTEVEAEIAGVPDEQQATDVTVVVDPAAVSGARGLRQ